MKLKKFLLLIIGLTWLVWAVYIHITSNFSLFSKYWPVSIIMVLGSFIAGATCQGGGAVAFPALTLIFDASSAVARNFSLAIQSIGMTAATLIILKSKMFIEKKIILFSSIGGLFGITIGSFFIASLIPSKSVKILFVSLWLSFGLALWLVNHDKKREIYHKIHNFSGRDAYKLILFGLVGGLITSFFGSGIDIFVFCLITLYYKINEKIATATAVVLMTINTVIGFFIHSFLIKDFHTAAFNYWLVSVPVVVIFAPLGSMYLKKVSRNSVIKLLYFIILLQFAGAYFVLKPNTPLILLSALTFMLSSFFFLAISKRKV